MTDTGRGAIQETVEQCSGRMMARQMNRAAAEQRTSGGIGRRRVRTIRRARARERADGCRPKCRAVSGPDHCYMEGHCLRVSESRWRLLCRESERKEHADHRTFNSAGAPRPGVVRDNHSQQSNPTALDEHGVGSFCVGDEMAVRVDDGRLSPCEGLPSSSPSCPGQTTRMCQPRSELTGAGHARVTADDLSSESEATSADPTSAGVASRGSTSSPPYRENTATRRDRALQCASQGHSEPSGSLLTHCHVADAEGQIGWKEAERH
jgi:hypothetical protein